MLISGKDINAERFVRVFRDKGIQFSTAGGVVRLDGPADITARAQAVLDALNTSPEAADNVLHFLTAEGKTTVASFADAVETGCLDVPDNEPDPVALIAGRCHRGIEVFASFGTEFTIDENDVITVKDSDTRRRCAAEILVRFSDLHFQASSDYVFNIKNDVRRVRGKTPEELAAERAEERTYSMIQGYPADPTSEELEALITFIEKQCERKAASDSDSMAGHSTAGTADAPLTDSDEHGKAEKDINTFAAENDAQEPSIKGIRVIVSGGSSLVQSAVAAGGHDAGAYVRTLKLLYKGGPDVLEFKDTLGEYERGLIDARFLQPDGEPVAEVLNAAVVFFAERKKI